MSIQNVDESIKRLKDLPTLPAVFIQCNEMLKDPGVNVPDFAKIIESDQAISSKMLKLVNSPFYGFTGKISTITQAIVILGFNAVRNIILSLSVFALLPKDVELGEFQISSFWEHSIGCGTIAKAFGKKFGIKDPEEAFLAGLLHDIGKVVLPTLFYEEFLAILSMVKKEKILFLEAEQKVLGIDHVQIGERLAKHWRLPSILVEPIAFHHNGIEAINHPAQVSIIHLADIVTRGLQIGSGGDNVIPEINSTAWSTLKMNSDILEKWIDDLDEELDKASFFFSLLSE